MNIALFEENLHREDFKVPTLLGYLNRVYINVP